MSALKSLHIEHLRKNIEITQDKFSESIGFSTKGYQNLLKIADPKLSVLLTIAKELKVFPESLYVFDRSFYPKDEEYYSVYTQQIQELFNDSEKYKELYDVTKSQLYDKEKLIKLLENKVESLELKLKQKNN